MSTSIPPRSAVSETSRTGHEILCRHRLAARLRRFGADDAGSVAVIFAVMLLILCLFVGAAIDFGRWAQARHQTIAAMDAAVLAGGRLLQVNEPVEVARDVALKYYIANTQGRAPVINDTIDFDAVDDKTAFAATGNAYIETSFLRLARIDTLPLLDRSKATYSKADLKTGGSNNDPVEISLMLDITGSMQDSKNTKKISALKEAAADLVNIVISDSPLANPARVALVPFSDAVRLPSSAFSKAVGTQDKIVKKTSGSGNNQRAYLYNLTQECVVERTGSNRYTDAGPGAGDYVLPYRPQRASLPTKDGTVLVDNRSTAGAQGAKVTVQWASNSSMSQSQKNNFVTTANSLGSCPISAHGELVPLTDDKQLLLNRIGNLPATGMTAGQLGTAWVWYTLSPNWNTLWSGPSAATSYGSQTKKIAILMTDGEYNTQYDASGISTSATGSGSAANGTSDSQARSLCTAMKAKGITVYTVGFALGRGSTAERTLEHCATDPTKAYTADNGDQLRDSFRDIALKITNLHLTQ